MIGVMTQIHWMVDDGRTANFLYDLCLFDLLLNRWPTFVNVEMGESMVISDLLHIERSDWHLDYVAQLFGQTWL